MRLGTENAKSLPTFPRLAARQRFSHGCFILPWSAAPLHVTTPEVKRKAGAGRGGVTQTPADDMLVGRGVFTPQHRATRTSLAFHPARAEPILPELREAATARLGSMAGAGTRQSWPEKYSPLVTQGQAPNSLGKN